MTAEFGNYIQQQIGELNIGKGRIAAGAQIDIAQFYRVLHGSAELQNPGKLVALMDVLLIPPDQQALFLLQAASVPSDIASRWLCEFSEADEVALEPIDVIAQLQELIPKGEIANFAQQIPIDPTQLSRIRSGNKGAGQATAVIIVDNLAIPNHLKAQFLLTQFGYRFEDIRKVLENLRKSRTLAPAPFKKKSPVKWSEW